MLHTPEIKYPESSVKVTLGRGYEFASKPRGPDQVEYILHFSAMFFFEIYPGELDLLREPIINMGCLVEFYEAHRLYEPFIYPLGHYSDKIVRFKEPLAFKMKQNGRGQTEPFQLKLILQP